MRIRELLRSSILLAALTAPFLASMVMSANATMRIAEDRGGQIGHYLQAFASLRSSGENVVIDGNCLSACTLVLGLIPKSRVCATSRARFGFHAAWMPDREGRPVTSPTGTDALWNIYPSPVKRWISRHGGLSRKMIYMQGREMAGIVSDCGEEAHRVNVRSERRTAPRPVRYSGASAASDRR
jgi:hypothetical protein